MKRLLLFTFFTLTSLILLGQSFSLEQKNESYTELTGASDITQGELWDDEEWELPVGFDFELFGKTYSSFTLNANGYIKDSIGGAELTIGLIGPDLVDGAFLSDPDSPIPVLYKTEGSTGDQILKVQWKKANVWGADSTNIVNYQIWFYEKTGDIEFRFGSFKLDDVPGIMVRLYSSGAYMDDGFALSGNPENAVASDIVNIKMTSSPIEEMVYTFKKENVQAPSGVNINGLQNELNVFPNPSSDAVNLSNSVEEIVIMNLAGKELVRRKGNIKNVDISNLNNGVYLMRVFNNGASITQKLIKK